MRDNRFIIGIGKAEREYSVNGVKYIVGSRFKPIDFNNIKDTLADAVERYIKNDFAEWTNDENGSIMNTECVSTAGKEDSCSRKRKNKTQG